MYLHFPFPSVCTVHVCVPFREIFGNFSETIRNNKGSMMRVNKSKKFLPSIQGCTPLFSYSHFRIDSRYRRIRQCMCVSPLVHRMIYYFYLTAVPRLGNQQADDEERCPHRGRIISPDEIRGCP